MTLLLLTIGVLIGAVLGLTGAGGSVLAVPLLVLLLHLDPASATGLALGVVAASSIYGSIQRIRHREMLWIPAIFGHQWRCCRTYRPHAVDAGFTLIFACQLFVVIRGDCGTHVVAKHTPTGAECCCSWPMDSTKH